MSALRSTTAASTANPRNQLADSTSPYLLQHADNPVDWQPWGEEAFAKARAEDKPIFLSVGYSTCHWCHVMAHESFENEAIAAVLNEHFINIKVDREERPDVDRVYMTFVQATTGAGGWPMSVWLTPDLQPFYGGTYFPPEDRWGRSGFPSVLQALARLWREDRTRVLEQATHAVQVLQQYAGRASGGGATKLSWMSVERGYEQLFESFDEQWGGFGDAPKFPRPATLELLWRVQADAAARGDEQTGGQARRMAEITLRRMIAGGIHDHLGGGFHRYAVDALWHVPHFEKMLYDQAQIACVLLAGWQAMGFAPFAAAARDTLAYVQRDLTAPDGAFYSAEDADSLPTLDAQEKREGAFYVWSREKIEAALGAEPARLFIARYGVESGGNAPAGADPHGEFKGLNILIEDQSLEEAAASAGLAPDVAEQVLLQSRAALTAVRNRRPRPHRDEKILTAWNGLMISAFARGAQALDDPMLAIAAQRAAEFISHHLWDAATGVLRRSFAARRAGADGYAEDYAFLIQGLLDLYEATFQIRWLRWALELQEAQDRMFWDENNGGYFSASGRDPSVLVRLKEDHDGAEPAASSVAALNLLRLGRMLGDAAMQKRAEQTMLAFSDTWANAPQAMPLMLSAVADALRAPRQIVLAGNPGDAALLALAREVRRRFLPGAVVLAADDEEGQAWLGERAAYLREMRPVDGRPAAYVCDNYACQRPVTEPEELGQLLDAPPKT